MNPAKWIRELLVTVTVLAIGSTAVGSARAEVKELRLAKQYGLGYLPLIIMEEQHLIEKHAKAAGLGDIKVTWATLGGAAPPTTPCCPAASIMSPVVSPP